MQQEIHHEKPILSALTREEINNPQLVLAELFDFAHLPELKIMLWDWLKTTVTGSYNKTLTNRERAAILLLYEYMEKLLEANHLLYIEQQKLDEKKQDEQRHIF
ncbi:hypothetical protein [Sediminibacterium sp.]|uniref:hypothetical protein n=1 Tax=Sediminibacterium sp. TaxID=1917865 RepID=UPI0025DF9807|nr:hypothetical protein [Sediminibacterium sp.]MBW0177778.1 hypothetical protein [Sediminibacterium sp.]